MGKKTGFAAVIIGAFLLVLAVLAKTYAYDELAVVPLDQETTTVSKTMPGEDATYLNVAAEGGPAIETGPLESRRNVVGQVEASKDASDELDENIAVWETFSYTAPPGTPADQALSGTRDVVPFERTTGDTVRWQGAETESNGVVISPFSFYGNYFKFPFNTQKESVDFWDDSLGKGVPAEYEGTEKIEGLEVYKFVQTVEPTKIAEQPVPGSLVGMPDQATVVADRMYANVRTLWVEPETGVIIKGQEEQLATLDVDGEPKATITEATLGYDDETVKATVDEYKTKAMLLGMIRTTIPVVGGILGGLLVLGGAVLLLRSRKGGDGDGDAQDAPSDEGSPAEATPAKA
ncbi:MULTISPECIES: DUF3068 domain-containing protein [Mumia]|uniref:DUF3068 domain-containing protein n=1 Tax=Mumia xiangluensis TaxID=1678900 RepID=A0ABW1QLQ4_9ACTN|nr:MULTISPECIES: DUF3068 domain-containing protein [Mumia]